MPTEPFFEEVLRKNYGYIGLFRDYNWYKPIVNGKSLRAVFSMFTVRSFIFRFYPKCHIFGSRKRMVHEHSASEIIEAMCF